MRYPDESVRPATAADIPVLNELRATHVGEAAPLRGGPQLIATLPAPEWLPPPDADACTWVGTLDGVAVAYALVARSLNPKVALVAELFVLAEAREVGLGEALRDACVASAREWGCTGIDAYALPGARATKNFFESGRFTARLLVVHSRI